MSRSNTQAGTRWSSEIATQLDTTSVGILCVTKEHQHEPWLMFEAGALAKAISSRTFLIPYLIDLNPGELRLPLSEFQAVSADKEGTFALVNSINFALQQHGEQPLPESSLATVFEACWPLLAPELDRIKSEEPITSEPENELTAVREMLEELLIRERRRGLKAGSVSWARTVPSLFSEPDIQFSDGANNSASKTFNVVGHDKDVDNFIKGLKVLSTSGGHNFGWKSIRTLQGREFQVFGGSVPSDETLLQFAASSNVSIEFTIDISVS